MIWWSIVMMQTRGAVGTLLSLIKNGWGPGSPKPLRLPKGELNLALIEAEDPEVYQRTLDGRLVPYKRDEAADD